MELLHAAPHLSIGRAARFVARGKALSPVAYWPLNERSGSTAADLSGNGRNAAYKSSSAPTKAQAGPLSGTLACLFGGSDYVNGYGASLAGAFNGDAIVISCWFSITAAALTDAAQHNLFSFRADSNNTLDLLKSTTNNQLRFSSNAAAAGQKNINTTISDSNLHHLAAYRNLARGFTLLYIDAVAVGGLDTAAAGSFTGALSSTNTVIGAFATTPTFGWKGLIAAVGVYGALAPADIAFLAGTRGQVVYVGDSLTVGAGNSYPSQTTTTLAGIKAAVSGRTIDQMATAAATEVDTLVRARVPVNAIELWAGTNNLGAGESATSTYNKLLSYIAARKAAGFTHIGVKTITKRGDAPWTGAMETERQSYNTMILGGAASNGYVAEDVASDAALQDTSNTTYFNADKEHLTATGYGVVAGYSTTRLAAI